MLLESTATCSCNDVGEEYVITITLFSSQWTFRNSKILNLIFGKPRSRENSPDFKNGNDLIWIVPRVNVAERNERQVTLKPFRSLITTLLLLLL